MPKHSVYTGLLSRKHWKKHLNLEMDDLHEARPKLCELFEKLVLLGEKYKKETGSFYVALDVRWTGLDIICDSTITMGYGDVGRGGEWYTELQFENRMNINIFYEFKK